MHTQSLLHVENTVVTCDRVAHRHQILWEYVCVYYGRLALIFVLFTCMLYANVKSEYRPISSKKNISNIERSVPQLL